VEDVLELEFGNDVSSSVADADFAQVDDVVLVGEDEHRQSRLRCERHVARVQELDERREDSLTLRLLVQLHLLSINQRARRALSRFLPPAAPGMFVYGAQKFGGLQGGRAGPPTTLTKSLDMHDYHKYHRWMLGSPDPRTPARRHPCFLLSVFTE